MDILDVQLIFEWSTCILALLFLACRLYIRFPYTIRSLGWELVSDLLVISAWLFFFEQAVLDFILIKKTTFVDDIWDDGVPLATRSRVNKMWFVEKFTYLNCMYAVKSSLLILYHQSFPGKAGDYKDWRWLRRGLIAVDFMVISGWALFVGTGLGICRPIWTNWSTDWETYCDYWDFGWYNYLVYGWHCATDIFVYILPFFIIRTLHQPLSTKIGLALTFIVGFLSVACSFVLIVGYQIDWEESRNFFFNDLEQCLAVIAGSLPALRAITEARIRRRDRAAVTAVDHPATTSDLEEGDPPPRKENFFTEAKQHSGWFRSTMIQEHLTRSELTSMMEDEVLERVKRFSPAYHARWSRSAQEGCPDIATPSTVASADTLRKGMFQNDVI